MQVKVLAFGIAKEIFDGSAISIDIERNDTDSLKNALEVKYPKLKELSSYMIAVNDEYANDKTLITQQDEIAIIPPVSGG